MNVALKLIIADTEEVTEWTPPADCPLCDRPLVVGLDKDGNLRESCL